MSAFTPENDLRGEHDFGAFEVAGRKFFLEDRDYYDEALKLGSEDPADPEKTARALIIMLAGNVYRLPCPAIVAEDSQYIDRVRTRRLYMVSRS